MFSKAPATFEFNLRLPGHYADRESGYYYNWHRYYDPSQGRYLTPDPIGLKGGPNAYVYANNQPARYIDLWGLRGLTSGEKEMAQSIFGIDVIDYDKVQLYPDDRYWALQQAGRAMTPNGNIYFYGSADYVSDFSAPNRSPDKNRTSEDLNRVSQELFIHEMTHVYQYYSGISVITEGIGLLVTGQYDSNNTGYKYELDCRKEFGDYNIEQQAEIIQHYFYLLTFKEQPSQTLDLFPTEYIDKNGKAQSFSGMTYNDILNVYAGMVSSVLKNPSYLKDYTDKKSLESYCVGAGAMINDPRCLKLN